MQRICAHHLLGLCGALLLSGCDAGPFSDSDQIATRVAQDRAVAATLTAEVTASQPTAPGAVDTPTAAAAAPTAAAAAPTAAAAAPTVTATAPTAAAAAPTAAATAPTAAATAPTVTAAAPTVTATAPTVTAESTATNTPEPPSPTPEPILAIFAPGGTANGLEGQIRVDGGGGYNSDTRVVPVLQVFGVRVEAQDPEALQSEDAGILRVIFRITEQQSGLLVYEHTEEYAPFCLFGDDNGICRTVNLQPGVTWPTGEPIAPGQHFIELEIQAENSERSEFWNFTADLALAE